MLLDARNISKSYQSGGGTVQVLQDISLQMGAGESIALTGESGSGKSTFLHLCAGLDRADSGQISISGQGLDGLADKACAQLRCQKIGLVFQQFNLIPSLDVLGNLSFQARLAGRYDQGRVQALAARLGLDHLLHRYPEELSGGQQQRVAIGRALAARPALILADEPTGNLDEGSSGTVMDLLLELVGETGAGLLMVTHSQQLAARLSRHLHLSSGRVQ